MFIAELGDYDPDEHSLGIVSEFHFVQNQSESMEEDILEQYQSVS